MKLLMCHNYYQQRGGEDESFESECRLLESRGHEVVRYTRHNDEIRSMRSWTVARRTLFNPRTRTEVGRLLRQHRPDVVHCTNTFPLISPAVYAAARAARVPVVQSVRNYRHVCASGYLFRDGAVCEDCLGRAVAWPGIARRCYRGSRAGSAVLAALQYAERRPGSWTRTVDLFFTPTEFARRKLVEAGLPAGRIVVKPNFLETDPGFGAGRGDYLVFVGRLSPEKGVATLLDAWAGMTDAPRLVVIGDGPLAGSVERAARRDPRIEWRGRCAQADVLPVVADAAALICPSTWYETFGRTVMEAYATGTPVIASDLGALAELVEHGRTGLRCPPGDVAALQAAVRRLWSSPDERARMRRLARDKFEREYTAEANHRQLVAIYERALGRHDGAGAVAGDRPPRVSIGLPVHNGERYLREAIDALLAQTYEDLELVISDNGSTDATEAICRARAATDPRVRYHREAANRGAAWNFNRVVELARGEYFKWAAADDLCAPTFVERCVAVLDGDPTVVCCHARTVKIDADGRPLPELGDPTDGGVTPPALGNGHRRPDGSSARADRRFRDVLLSIGWGARSYAVIRTAALRRTGLIRPAYGSEKVMMAELSLIGRFHDVPEPLFFQREHDGASSVLATAGEQAAFFDPALAGRRTFPRLVLLRGYLAAALGGPVSPLERGLCLGWILRYLFQVRKWRAVWRSIVHRTGARRARAVGP